MRITLSDKNIYFSPKFQKNYSKIDKAVREVIEKKMKAIFSGEREGNIKKLKNYPLAEYRLKIGNFRFLFNMDAEEKNVVFVVFRHRKDLY